MTHPFALHSALCSAAMQDPSACDFGGVGQIATKDPTTGTCKFLLGLKAYNPATAKSAMRSVAPLSLTAAALALVVLLA